jgi:multidrug efflux pump
LDQAAINSTLSAAWGGVYINDFIDRGRVKRVYMQGDAAWRSTPDNLSAWFVRGDSNNMASFDSFSSFRWTTGPQMLQRFNGLSAVQFQGNAAPGVSSGAAMATMSELVGELSGFEGNGAVYPGRSRPPQCRRYGYTWRRWPLCFCVSPPYMKAGRFLSPYC